MSIIQLQYHIVEMPFACPVCDNEEYNEDNGGLFCTECGTQSQEYVVQEVSVPDVIDPGIVRHKVAEATVENRSKRNKVSLGRPWTMYEAYQIIIMAQADSLTALGASENLKDVVYTLWANYLSKLGVAFCKKESIVPDVVEKYKTGRVRELFRGTPQKPSNLRKQPFPRRGKRKAFKKKKPVSRPESEGDKAHKDKSKEEKPVNPLTTIFLDTLTVSDMTYERDRAKAKTSPQWMDIGKTIAFCYIGLAFTNPDILPYDIVRWVYKNQVPLLSTSHLLPEEMVLSNHDSFLFSVERFTPDSLICEVNKLRKYLDLTHLPSPDINNVASRFIRDLYLPKEFCVFVKRLIQKIPFTWNSNKTLYSPSELVALGYIILALKVVFGLDDVSEKSLSEYSKELQILLELEPELFIWSEWKHFWMEKQSHQFDPYQEITSDISSSQTKYLDDLLHFYEDSNKGKRRISVKYNLSSVGSQVRHFDPDFRDALAKPLEATLAESSLTKKGGVADSDREELWRAKSEEFRKSTVCHLADIPSFRNKVESLDMMHKCHKLLEKSSELRPNFSNYRVASVKSDLISERHQSYLWLLDLASRISGCQTLALDKVVVRLSHYFVMLCEGKPVEGLTFSMFGIYGHGKDASN